MAAHLTKRLLNASTGLGRVAVITGGASGLGAASALAFARAGAGAIVLTDLGKQRDLAMSVIEQALNEVGSGLKAAFVEQDVTREAEWVKVVEETHKLAGPMDVLVNSAGIGIIDPVIEDLDMANWDRTIAINLTGTVLGMKYGIRSMKERKAKEAGSIINISSIEGIIAEPHTLSYNASKGGVRIATKAAALCESSSFPDSALTYSASPPADCAQQKYGIRINSVHPGYIATPLLGGVGTGSDSPEAVAARTAIEARHPLGRMGQPREIADGILFLASDESSFMTGSELVIDGGYTAQ
ncbi:short-chain dehydrogenase/reductase SDR [Hyaloraphidium curvatum]|nr:short-chain dehydrogenase/reductase SDR [Hyaloraphidium curvatum]